ncbi:hypothetical protein PBRA_001127 [Plasmodiophora brassicae]|uniref:DUF5050 domain-containing protein n=1 Tax=Plasmodiophora brassicae TaxID=37360 RepID=A0A0G4IVY1_PLABS|nr:hypothetical protein PBRA_001127 [Plasmodiophora brassicae]
MTHDMVSNWTFYPTSSDLLDVFQECRCSTIGHTEIFRTCLSTLTKVVVAILTETTTSSIRRIGVGSSGLTLYRCSRGTNCCESNHRVLKKKFGSLDAGIALTEALMLQHVLRTNVRIIGPGTTRSGISIPRRSKSRAVHNIRLAKHHITNTISGQPQSVPRRSNSRAVDNIRVAKHHIISHLMGSVIVVIAIAGLQILSAAALSCRADGACAIYVPTGKDSAQNPCYSYDGTNLVLTLWHGGYNLAPAGVYSMSITSSGPLKTIVNDNSRAFVNLPGSCWSAHGTITLAADGATTDEVSVVNSDGSGYHQVTNHNGASYIEPSFSSDANRIVFESSISSTSAEIWMVNSDGTGLKRLTSGSQDRQPNWSPKGDKILFQRFTNDWAIYTMNTDGSSITRVTPTTWSSTDAAFSPDGQFIVFSGADSTTVGARIAIVSISGSTNPVFITNSAGYDGAASWSPDGSSIAFETSTNPNANSPTSIYQISVPIKFRPSSPSSTPATSKSTPTGTISKPAPTPSTSGPTPRPMPIGTISKPAPTLSTSDPIPTSVPQRSDPTSNPSPTVSSPRIVTSKPIKISTTPTSSSKPYEGVPLSSKASTAAIASSMTTTLVIAILVFLMMC